MALGDAKTIVEPEITRLLEPSREISPNVETLSNVREPLAGIIVTFFAILL
jgi:hypothetical protein